MNWRLRLPWTSRSLLWAIPFALLSVYVAARMGVLNLYASVPIGRSEVTLPNTFASVDHPFHVARAEILWRELSEGRLLRWVGQHQGGYPVEFYPLGVPWFEVALRGGSLGALSAEGAHTFAVIAIFLLPGVGFLALSRQDRISPAVAFLALALHVALPGGWYSGGYTELVQWGLVTNVAGAVAIFLMLPPATRFVLSGDRRSAALAALLGAAAIYCNPRSTLGLLALAIGAWAAAMSISNRGSIGEATWRVVQLGLAVALLAAPELLALIRYADLYTFVQYSSYADITDFAKAAASSISAFVLVLGVAGMAYAIRRHESPGSLSAAWSLVVYGSLTILFGVVPAVSTLAPQLEATRLMPLQRLLTIYLAAWAIWASLSWGTKRTGIASQWFSPLASVIVASAILLVQTWPPENETPDPAAPLVPASSLFPVAMSGQHVQADLAAAIRHADQAAQPGTALLVLGSALSWHQQLWAPLWTKRPLYYDNWLWYWHPHHFGTPGYQPAVGNHYPDTVNAIQPEYLAAHGIGAIVVTGAAGATAANANWLDPVFDGRYDVYRVVEPTSTVTFGAANAAMSEIGNQHVRATSKLPASQIEVRANWFPRWKATEPEGGATVARANDGSIHLTSISPISSVSLTYALTATDWIGRLLAIAGILGIVVPLRKTRAPRVDGHHWYAQPEDEMTRAMKSDGMQ